MKNILLIAIIFYCVMRPSVCFCQSGLEKLTTDSLKSVIIISKFSSDTGTEKVVTDKKDVEKLLDFLKKIKLIQCSTENCMVDAQKFRFYFSFEGWRDKIYLFEKVIFIGKSRYRINKETARKFEKVFNSLNSCKLIV